MWRLPGAVPFGRSWCASAPFWPLLLRFSSRRICARFTAPGRGVQHWGILGPWRAFCGGVAFLWQRCTHARRGASWRPSGAFPWPERAPWWHPPTAGAIHLPGARPGSLVHSVQGGVILWSRGQGMRTGGQSVRPDGIHLPPGSYPPTGARPWCISPGRCDSLDPWPGYAHRWPERAP